MTGIDELRRTLEDHASDVAATDVVSRTASVHHRVGVVRRRRRGAVAAGAVAVLVIAGGVALLPGDGGPEPAGRTVVGVEAPARMMSLDYAFDFDRVVDGDGSTAAVTLEASDEPHLVSWATSGDNDKVTVQSTGGELVRTAPDFEDFVLVFPGDEQRVRVRAAAGDVGLAVYRLADERPAGVTDDGITYRRDIDDRTLVDALIGEPGDSDISLEVSTPAGRVAYAVLCAGAPERARVRVGRGVGEGYFEYGCGDGSSFDPGADAPEVVNLPATDAPVRVWVVDGQGDAVVDPDIRLGVGVYEVSRPLQSAARQKVRYVVEDGGHRWRLDAARESVAGPVTMRIPQDGPRLVMVLVSGRVREIIPVVDGISQPHTFANHTPDPVGFLVGQLDAGAEITISDRTAAPGVSLAIVTYVRTD